MERNLELGGGIYTSSEYHARRPIPYQSLIKWESGLQYPYVTVDAGTMIVGAYILATEPMDSGVIVDCGFKTIASNGTVTYGNEISGRSLSVPAIGTIAYKAATIYCSTAKNVYVETGKKTTKGAFTVVLDLIKLDTQVHFKMNIPKVVQQN